jgi:hypothetical protein
MYMMRWPFGSVRLRRRCILPGSDPHVAQDMAYWEETSFGFAGIPRHGRGYHP